MQKKTKRRNGKPFNESCEIEAKPGDIEGRPVVALHVTTGKDEPSRMYVLDVLSGASGGLCRAIQHAEDIARERHESGG